MNLRIWALPVCTVCLSASLIMAAVWGLKSPSPAELTGALILIAAIVLLSLAPRLSRPVAMARAGTT